MNIQGEIVLKIYDNNFDFVSLKDFLKPSKITNKGDLVGGDRVVQNSSLSYSVRFDSYEDFELKIDRFSDKIDNEIDQLTILRKTCDRIDLNIYIRSENGQFGFILPINAIKRLSQLKVDINFHILSFGMVEN